MCTGYKPLVERKVLSSIKVPLEASQILTQGSLNASLIERLKFVASTTMRLPLPFPLSLLELLRSQWGDVIHIMHQYSYHPQQGMTIHSSSQLKSFVNDGNDKMIRIPGSLQRIQTVDGYVFPLSIQDGGLPYLGIMRP
jgi:hypothetical protein